MPDYVGPLRDATTVCEYVSTVIPSMLWEVFPQGKYSAYKPIFRQNVSIVKGVLDYAQ